MYGMIVLDPELFATSWTTISMPAAAGQKIHVVLRYSRDITHLLSSPSVIIFSSSDASKPLERALAFVFILPIVWLIA